MDIQKYYGRQSRFSDPGQFTSLYSIFPDDILALTQIIRGIIVHQHETLKYYGFDLPEGREIEPNTRYVENILGKLLEMDHSPLDVERVPEKRFIGLCRDFAILLASILRYKGIPARLRCGFANYFEKGKHLDHWLCEYFDAEQKRWILVDTEVDDLERRSYSIPDSFNNLDVSHEEYWVSSKAWRKCSEHPDTENDFGVTSIGVSGSWFIRANMFRDLASLNKIELCPWDYTTYSDKQFETYQDIGATERGFLGDLTNAIDAVYEDPNTVQEFYRKNQKVQVCNPIRSYTNLGVVEFQM